MFRCVTFLIIAFITYWTPIQGQDHSKEWAPVGATWHYRVSSNSVSQFENVLKLTSIKDTVIHEKNARIIIGTLYDYAGDTTHTPDIIEDGRIILHQKGDSIYYLRKDKFELLYNFSLKAGDTMNIATPWPYWPDQNIDTMIQIVVDSTGQKLIGRDTLRTQFVSTNYSKFNSSFQMNGQIIEKIGHQEFLLPNYKGLCDANCIWPLRCYQDTAIFYKSVDVGCDTVFLITASDLRPGIRNIMIYPNPVSPGAIQIRIDGLDLTEAQTFEWTLRDIQGKFFYRGAELRGTRIIEFPGSTPAGMYFIGIRAGQERYLGKLVVQ